MNDSTDLVADMAMQLFDCLRNVYLTLAVGDSADATEHLDEARRMHTRLELIAQDDATGAVGRTLLAVLDERLGGLAALIGEGRAAH